MMIKIIISTFLVFILDICFILISETSETFRKSLLIFVLCYTVIKYFKIDIIKKIVSIF